MSLLQQLACAALDTHGAEGQPGAAASVQALLQQLGAAIAAIHAQQGHLQHQADDAAGTPADRASKFVVEVQAGLQATNQQLQRLLAQQGNSNTCQAPPPGQQQQQWQQQQQPGVDAAAPAAPTQANGSSSTGSTSIAVLQKLLQLAAGNPCGSAEAPVHSTAFLTSPHTATRHLGVSSNLLPDTGGLAAVQHKQQQQDWCRTAWEALQLFSFDELEQLPACSLQQALLLHPQLLDQFLQAAAAAVLKPMLQTSAVSGTHHSEPLTHLAGPEGSSDQPAGTSPVPQAARAAAACGDSSGGSSGAAGGVQNMQHLLAESCPWMQSLPGILAGNPVLLLRASSTLLSWIEASGHTRLWQLLSTACRPAWQQLAAADAAGHPANQAADASNAPPTAHSAGSSRHHAPILHHQEGLTRLEPPLQQLCPQPWQQRLVLLLVQEPSVLGLLQLLQLTPGQQFGLQQEAGGSGVAANSHAIDPCLAAPWSNEELLAWPTAQEWGQPAAAQLAAAEGSSGTQEGPETQDSTQVLLAWGLVMQHLCWYQFACSLLVSSSLQLLQAQAQAQPPQDRQQQQHQQQQMDLAVGSAPELLQQLLQSPAQQLQQQAQGLPAAQLAAAAAAFIAWVHQPAESDRQAGLVQQLLAAITAAGRSFSTQPPQAAPLQVVACLLESWTNRLCCTKQGRLQQQTEQPEGKEAANRLRCSQSWVSPVLFAQDLPCAVLRQRQLLLQCPPQQLVDLCLLAAASFDSQAAAAGDAQSSPTQPLCLSKQMQQQGTAAAGAGSPSSARAVPSAALCQLLDCSNELCGAALEVVNVTVQHGLLLQQAGDSGAAVDITHLSWLARQWLADDTCADGPTGRVPVVPGLSVAKQLLAAATGVNQQLKHCRAA